MARIVIVVAVAENGVIGRDNALPWRLSADLKRFRALTTGKPVLMGRKTYDSIGRALPDRTNIVVSRRAGLTIAGCIVVDSIERGLDAAGTAPEVAVIGGAALFAAVLPRTQTIHLTRVHADVPGDVFFPALDPGEWRETVLERHLSDARHTYEFSFVELERRRS
jgi:dihydrofolate reductase